MKPVVFKENRAYSYLELVNKFGEFYGSTDELCKKVIRKLQLSKILTYANLDTDNIDDIIVEEQEDEIINYGYKFRFVGIVLIFGFVIIVYPKYCEAYDSRKMKVIFKVIEKYSRSLKDSYVKNYDSTQNSNTENLLSVELFLLNDYWENGLYSNEKVVFENNGLGEINWEKSINTGVAIISNNRPYYTELFTSKRTVEDNAFITLLHKAILNEISMNFMDYENQDEELISLFDISPVCLTDNIPSDMADNDYLIYRLEKEISGQFNTRKLQLLNAMIVYLCKAKPHNDINIYSIYGTRSFHMIWQEVCSQVFGNKLYSSLGSLGINDSSDKTKLIDLIDKPYWNFSKTSSDETLEPDIVSIQEKAFIILDAKYYVSTIEKNKKVENVPGIGDITKQYLYQRAFYRLFESGNRYCDYDVFNCLLLPSDTNNVIDKGAVSLEMMRKDWDLADIQIRLVPADALYHSYLTRKPAIDHITEYSSDNITQFLLL